MHEGIGRTVLAISIFLIATRGGAQSATIPQEIARARTYFKAAGHYDRMFSSGNTCLARGFSAEVCAKAHAICAINDAAGTVYGNIATLLDAFQVDCGNGICFACCFTGAGCHTSFFSPDYLPVLNCGGAGYGPVVFQAGPTVIVDPDAKPGDACLFIGQTCDHLPLCVSGKSSQEIERINNDPGHVMKSAPAVNSRARTYATVTLSSWSRSLSAFHTSSPEQSDSIRTQVRDFSALSSFVTGRGCAGWRNSVPASFTLDWSDPLFRLVDEDGDYAEEASHYNGLRQLGTAQLLRSVPNVYERLKYVESRIWTPAAIEQYLAPIGDADATLLRTMSPIALEILKKNVQLQDYRLLAVPLAGESVPARLYNGCTLGNPPAVQLSHRQRGALGIDVDVNAAPGVEALLLWGDGSVTPLVVPAIGSIRIPHDYSAGGKYQVLIVAQNDTGLRTVGALVAETSGKGTNPASTPTPVVSEVQLVDLRATLDSFAGNAKTMLFELEGWPGASEGHGLGVSRPLKLVLETPVRFGTVAGWNVGAAPLRSVTVRPSSHGEGILLGFRGIYFTVDRVRLGVYSTERNRLRYYDLRVTPEMVRLYPEGSDAPVAHTQPVFDADGRLRIPVQSRTARYSRIDVVFPQSFFAEATQKPVTDVAWTGLTGTVPELIPDDGDDLAVKRRTVRH